MKVFVTGGTGVLGRPVVKMLANRKDEVLVLVRSQSNRDTLRGIGAETVSADLYDPESLAGHLDGCDAVLHLATNIPKTRDLGRASAWADNDRIRGEGTRALVDAALMTTSIRKFVYPSVFFMYGDRGLEWQSAETAMLDPPPPLRSTLVAEEEVARFGSADERNAGVSLRFGGFYGPASRDSQETISMARKGFVLPLAPRNTYRSMIWIDDAASAIIAALDHASGGIFDVAEDDPVTQEQTIAALARSVGRKRLFALPRLLLRLALPDDLRHMLARSQRVTSQAFKNATGWRPAVSDQNAGWEIIASTPAATKAA